MIKPLSALLAAAAVVACTACSEAPETPEEPATGQMIRLSISTANPDAIATRTMVADDGITPMWTPDDQIGVSVFTNGAYTNYAFSNESSAPSKTTTFTGTTAVSSVIFTYYPYSAAGVDAQGRAQVSIPAVQYPTATSFDGAADLLVGRPVPMTASTTRIEGLQFKRVGGFLKIVLEDQTGGQITGEAVSSLSVTAADNLAGSMGLDIVNGELGEVTGNASKTVTATYTAATQHRIGDGKATYLGVYPQRLAQGSTLTIAAATDQHSISRTITLPSAIEIPAGEITTLKISISEAHLSEPKIDINTAFPDPNFRAYVLENIDTDKDGILSEAEALAVTHMAVSDGSTSDDKKIATMEGIQYFTNLTYLSCGYNKLTDLDVSKNTALDFLFCYGNQLTDLDVSKNTALTDLNCGENQLTSLDVSKNTALTELHCKKNQLTSLDVSKNTALTSLDCGENQLTSLDVNTALTSLHCSGNQLANLDVSKVTALSFFICQDNQLTDLDVSKNTALIHLICGSNKLTSLDVSKNTALSYLSCEENQLTSLDVTNTNLHRGILFCSPMNTLEILYLIAGWEIDGITKYRDERYIPEHTQIVFVSGDYGDEGGAGGELGSGTSYVF